MHMRTILLLGALCASADASAVTIAEAKRVVANGLKDPGSVQFRNVQQFKRTGAVCGEFNARNSFGGYVGFAPFGVDKDGAAMDAPSVDGLNASYAQAATRQFLRECAGD